MRWFLLLASALAIPVITAAHPVGEMHRTMNLASAAARHVDHRATMAVTIWYPAAPGTRETEKVIGPAGKPFFRVASMGDDAQPAKGRRPTILLSHGFGGSAEIMGWLGAALARDGYIVISVDHPGNSDDDMSDVGSLAWWERPRDLIAALQAMQQDPQFKPLIDRRKVGAAGFSIGGMTVLALAGARIDPSNFDRFCLDHPADGVCQKPPERRNQPDISRADGISLLGLTSAQEHAGDGTALPGLKAAFAIAPPTQQLAQDSFARIRIPVAIVSGDKDLSVPPRNHAELAVRAIRGAKLVIIPGAAHYTFLATCTDAARGRGGACDSAPAQEIAYQVAIREALMLFHRTLGKAT